jgi:CBS domain-containing protein
MFRIKDVMTKNVVSVKKDAPIYEALMLLRKNDVAGMPVVDNDMIVIGIITEKDVLKMFWAEGNDQNKTVDFYMTRPVISFGVDESLESICDVLMVKNFRRVPVVSTKGKLVGIISRPDIIDYIILQKQINVAEHLDTKLTSPAK